MKYWFFLWVFLSAFQAFSQYDYEHAVRLFEEADSIRFAEDNQLEKDKSNYQLAILKFEEARDLFNAVDSTYFGFRCEVGVLKCRYYAGGFDFREIQGFKDRIVRYGIRDSLLGITFYYEGSYWYNQSDIREALKAFNKSLNYLEDKGTKHLVNVYWFLALNYSKLEEHDLEIINYEKALEILNLSSSGSFFKVRAVFTISKNLMSTYIGKRDFNSFFKAYNECRTLLKKYPGFFLKTEESSLLSELAKGYFAGEKFNKALEVYRKISDIDSARSDLTYGLVLNALERNEEAIVYYKRLLAKGRTHPPIARIYNNIGHIFTDLDELDSALHYYRLALRLNRDSKFIESISINLGNIGDILSRKGQLGIAEEFLLEALSFNTIYQKSNHWYLSENYLQKGEFYNAIVHSIASLFNESGELAHLSVPRPFNHIFRASKGFFEINEKLYSIGNKSYLFKSLELVNELHFETLNRYDYFEKRVLDFSFIYEQGIRHSLILAKNTDRLKYLNKAFQFSEWSKVHSLQRAKKSSQAKFLAGLPETVIDKERSLKIDENYFRSQLSKQENLDLPDSSRIIRYRNILAEITESQDSLENIIRINYPRYHQLRYQDITLSVEEVQERLKPSQAFVEYYEGDSTSFVFTITKEDYQVKRIHLDDDTLIALYRAYFEPDNFSPAQQEVNELSYQIYQNYLQPAIGELNPNISELIVVPDGKLSYVPFDILLTEATQSQGSEAVPYLLRDYQVHYTYSASLYFNDFSTLSTKDEYLAFAPEYETTLTDTASINRLGSFRNQVTPLKYNQDEVSYISSQFKGLGYFGAHANERNFKEKVDEYGVLHLAMHTIVDDEDPMNSKLVFANSKDSLEDDMLHAFEIYNMEIPSKLAVLSACETGFGQLAKGEGALSLARAFSYAGSPSVVMSHWPVDDQTTAVLMKSFYNYLSKGLSKSDALRKSKLDFLDQTHSARMHPFFWGSFVVMGDDSPIYIKRLPQVNPFLVLIGCLLILSSAGFFVHRYEL